MNYTYFYFLQNFKLFILHLMLLKKLRESLSPLMYQQYLFFAGSTKLKNKSLAAISYTPEQALRLVRCHALAAFDETLDITMNLNVDPKKGDQLVRGKVVLPNNIGRDIKIAFFATNPEHLKIAEEVGIQFIGNDQLLNEIKEEKIKFDKCMATQDGLALLKPYARILGQRKLYPNPKIGTLIEPRDDVKKCLTEAKQSQVEFRCAAGGIIHSPLGKLSHTDNSLLENFESFVRCILSKQPSVIKQKYVDSVYIKSTMGPAFKISTKYFDSKNKEFKYAEFQQCANLISQMIQTKNTKQRQYSIQKKIKNYCLLIYFRFLKIISSHFYQKLW